MDEPLGALDKKLREHMQIELKQIHEMLGVTIVYVTHDQSEALTMSDRVAIFDGGAIVQIGTPDGLYKEPATAFVASFIGENNALEGIAERVERRPLPRRPADGIESDGVGGRRYRRRRAGPIGDPAGADRRVGCRRATGRIDFKADVDGRIYHGDHQRAACAPFERASADREGRTPKSAMATGETIDLCWPAAECRAFPAAAAKGGVSK